MIDHAGKASQIVADVMELRPETSDLLAIAQVHALLAVADAIAGLEPPVMEADEPPVPFEFTKEGQQWP